MVVLLEKECSFTGGAIIVGGDAQTLLAVFFKLDALSGSGDRNMCSWILALAFLLLLLHALAPVLALPLVLALLMWVVGTL